jgi:titin
MGNTSAVSSDYTNVEESRTSVPADPTDLVATAVSSTQIDLTWTDNANNETEYRILRSGNGTDYNLIDTISRNSTSYSAVGLQDDKKYWFKVRAVNGSGNNVSNAANARTLP